MDRGPLRDALAVGAATGAYGLSFGAVAVAADLSVLQACALSLLMFTGASQFAFVGVVGAGGGALVSVLTAALVGSRNAFYGLRLAELLGVRGRRRLVAAQLVIDESAAMAVGREDPRTARQAFWATGTSVFVLWNLATLVGALGADAVGDPAALGLDAAAPAAFLALLAPSLRDGRMWAVALAAAALALAATPLVPAGAPILLAAALAVAVGLAGPREREPAPR
jgi:predicted branched-subunit amino acid permease